MTQSEQDLIVAGVIRERVNVRRLIFVREYQLDEHLRIVRQWASSEESAAQTPEGREDVLVRVPGIIAELTVARDRLAHLNEFLANMGLAIP